LARRLRVAIVLNPVAGVRGTLDRARRRAELAMDLLVAEQVEPEILITERAGHARELAGGAVDRGARIVVAWGGDGTVNEVASALAGTATALAVIPAGSGNGLARMIGMPADPARAIPRLLHGADRLIDLGEIDGRLFVNVAGVGFDAHIAAEFAALGRARRGFLRYGAIVLRELGRYQPLEYGVALRSPAPGCPADPCVARAFLLSFANGRQWGNGAIIAPNAELDDGLLDAVLVEDRGRGSVLRALPRLFQGAIARVPGVAITSVVSAVVSGPAPLCYHADGESFRGGSTVAVRVLPRVLRLRA
jgi:diacylglycerol kinase (ATP)